MWNLGEPVCATLGNQNFKSETFMWNLAEPEPLGVEPVYGTLGNLNCCVEPVLGTLGNLHLYENC